MLGQGRGHESGLQLSSSPGVSGCPGQNGGLPWEPHDSSETEPSCSSGWWSGEGGVKEEMATQHLPPTPVQYLILKVALNVKVSSTATALVACSVAGMGFYGGCLHVNLPWCFVPLECHLPPHLWRPRATELQQSHTTMPANGAFPLSPFSSLQG